MNGSVELVDLRLLCRDRAFLLQDRAFPLCRGWTRWLAIARNVSGRQRSDSLSLGRLRIRTSGKSLVRDDLGLRAGGCRFRFLLLAVVSGNLAQRLAERQRTHHQRARHDIQSQSHIAPLSLLMRTVLIIVAPFGWIAKRRQ